MMTKNQDADPISEGEDALVVLITVASLGEAERIARRLVEDRLAACVNIVPQVRSLFIWQGKFSQEDEVLLVVKSRRARFRELTTAVKQLHSYSVPEIIALPILVGSSDYLRWVAEST
jgi:periplasmic divalent cation tolerance protein